LVQTGGLLRFRQQTTGSFFRFSPRAASISPLRSFFRVKTRVRRLPIPAPFRTEWQYSQDAKDAHEGAGETREETRLWRGRNRARLANCDQSNQIYRFLSSSLHLKTQGNRMLERRFAGADDLCAPAQGQPGRTAGRRGASVRAPPESDLRARPRRRGRRARAGRDAALLGDRRCRKKPGRRGPPGLRSWPSRWPGSLKRSASSPSRKVWMAAIFARLYRSRKRGLRKHRSLGLFAGYKRDLLPIAFLRKSVHKLH